jgi:uncharacterized protein (UPF0332 family)
MDEQTQVRVRNWLKRADEYLRAAEYEFQGEFYARSISTVYYAMFYAATGALASIGIKRAKHSGVISAFGEHFIRSGKLNREIGQILSRTLEDREESDYSEMPVIDRELAEQRLRQAYQFLEAVVGYLREQGLKLT